MKLVLLIASGPRVRDRNRLLVLAGPLCAALLVANVGCGGGGSVVTHQSSPPTSVSKTVPLTANTALPMPSLSGFSGTFTEADGVAPGTTVRLTTTLTQPAGAPAPLIVLSRGVPFAQTGGAGTPIIWVGQQYSAAVTFGAFPATTWQLPPNLTSAGPFKLEEFDGTTRSLIDIELPTSISATGLVTFGGSAASFTTIVGHTYWWELIKISSPPGSAIVPLVANLLLPMPPLGGFSGTFTEVSPVPRGTTVALTTLLTAPAGAPTPLIAWQRRLPSVSQALAQTASAGTPIVWVSQNYSADMTLFSPITTWQLPPNLSGTGPFELEEFDGTTNTLVDIELSTDVSSSGLVTFGGSPEPFTTVANHTYWWELITGFSPMPSPTPCGSGTLSTTLNPAGQNIVLPAVCGVSGNISTSSNNATAGDNLNVGASVPALSPPLGAPAKPGTSTGVITVSTDVAVTAMFSSGMGHFVVDLPSSIPTAGKTFFLSACTIEVRYRSNGTPINEYGCTTSPFIAGPLTVSGQAVSYAGLPFNLTLPGPVSCGPAGKHCVFYYRISVFY